MLTHQALDTEDGYCFLLATRDGGRRGRSRAGGNSSRYFPSLWSLSMGVITPSTSHLPGKQGGLRGNEVGKQHRVLGASGPEPADAFFTFFSGKIKADSLVLTSSEGPPLDQFQPSPASSILWDFIYRPAPPSSGTSATPLPGSFPSAYKCSQVSLIQKHRYSKIKILNVLLKCTHHQQQK